MTDECGPFDAEALKAATEAVKRNREFAVSIPGEKYLFVAPEDQAYDTLLAAWEALPKPTRERLTGGLALTEAEALRAERDRAIETRENANACTLRVEAERDSLRVDFEALLEAHGHRAAERDAARAEVARLIERACGWEQTANRLATDASEARADVDALLEAVAAVKDAAMLHHAWIAALATLHATANEIAVKRESSRTSSPSRTL
jgi:hypothetical protein